MRLPRRRRFSPSPPPLSRRSATITRSRRRRCARSRCRSRSSRRNDDPQGILRREATRLGYGADSPYARVAEYETVSSITRDDLLAFHKAHVAPNNIIFGLVGDFDAAQMEQKLRSAFGS